MVAVKPRLSETDRAGREALGVAVQFVADLRQQKFPEAWAAVSESAKERMKEADLQTFEQEIQKRQARWTPPQAYVSEGGGRVRVRWDEGRHDRFLEVILRRDAQWRVSEVKFSPSK
jgi:hypothetical protein